MKNEKLNIPDNWEVIRFEDCFVSVNPQIKIKQKFYKTAGEIPIIDQGINLIGGYTDIVENTVKIDLPVIVFGDHTRIIKFIDFQFAAGADGIKIIKNIGSILLQFYYYYLKYYSTDLPNKGYARHFQYVKKIIFPLPPLNEQRRITAKIEELFSALDKGTESLKKAQQQLKLYRQALLKNAFEGKLTEKWREDFVKTHGRASRLPTAEELLEAIKQERQTRYLQELEEWEKAVKKWEEEGKQGRKPQKPKAPKELPPLSEEELKILPKLSDGWKYEKIANICETNPKNNFQHKINDLLEVQFVPMKLVEELKNTIHLTETRSFSEVQHKSYTYFTNDDIIFAKVTPCMENGKIAIAKNLKNNIAYGSSEFHVIRCVKEFDKRLIFYYLIQDIFRKTAERAMTGAVGLRRVPITFIENFLIPVPPLPEQNQIVSILEEQFSVIDKLEEEIEKGLKKAELLRQSILKKAFEGKLVPQDPDDEPASELLKRIKAEKEKYLAEQKQKKKTVKTQNFASPKKKTIKL